MNMSPTVILWRRGPFQHLSHSRHVSIYKKVFIKRFPTKFLLEYSSPIPKVGAVNYYSSPINYQKSIPETGQDIAYLPRKKTITKSSTTINRAPFLKFKCPHCEFIDAEKDTIKRHVISVHKVKPFACPHCKEAFTNFKTMNKHMQANHPLEKRLTEPYELIKVRDSTSLSSEDEQLEKKQIVAKRVSTKISKPKDTGNLIAESIQNGGPPIVMGSENHESDTPILDRIINNSAVRNMRNDINNSLNSSNTSVPDNHCKDKVSSTSEQTKIEFKTNFNLGK